MKLRNNGQKAGVGKEKKKAAKAKTDEKAVASKKGNIGSIMLSMFLYWMTNAIRKALVSSMVLSNKNLIFKIIRFFFLK